MKKEYFNRCLALQIILVPINLFILWILYYDPLYTFKEDIVVGIAVHISGTLVIPPLLLNDDIGRR